MLVFVYIHVVNFVLWLFTSWFALVVSFGCLVAFCLWFAICFVVCLIKLVRDFRLPKCFAPWIAGIRFLGTSGLLVWCWLLNYVWIADWFGGVVSVLFYFGILRVGSLAINVLFVFALVWYYCVCCFAGSGVDYLGCFCLF